LADEVLIESTNRQIEEIWKKARRYKHNLLVLRKSRNELVGGMKDTLFAIKETANQAIIGKLSNDMAFREINKLTNEQLSVLESYKYILKGDFYEQEDDTKAEN
jgi:hypothetical protein